MVILTVIFLSEKQIGFKTGKLHAILTFNHVLRMISE